MEAERAGTWDLRTANLRWDMQTSNMWVVAPHHCWLKPEVR